MGLHRLLQKRSYSYPPRANNQEEQGRVLQIFHLLQKSQQSQTNHIAQQKLQMSIPTPVLQKAHSGEPAGANNELIVR